MTFRNDSVADSEKSQELIDDIAGWVVAQVGVQLLEVVNADLNPILDACLLSLLNHIGIGKSCNRALTELHLVTGQCSCLVRKDVLDLPKFFDKRRGTGESRGVRFFVVHVQVRVDQLRLPELDDLHSDHQRDGDQVVVQNQEGEDVATKVSPGRVCEFDVRELFEVLVGDDHVTDSRGERHCQEDTEQEDDLNVGHLFDRGTLDGCC